ncbi:conserved Plasmodium protein, unknown function [Plasmodium gallinaceum]|uniref:Uncharacterized protein n=1 Tax=Plasmodium gallinaceum TaxID=5849 RepID=A0A1J1H286_PLAGA|nr:conserved Plasmodium protein, unknown function [Plasmodium gallinaceum]CRG97446.1 conserved Plasmodium protein, unknown function [Plasmodium gallinaceum]
MSSIEEQIKNIENKINVQEKKIKNLGEEIGELKNESSTIYEKLIRQKDVLLKKKETNILMEFKINNLKYESIKVTKSIEDTYFKIDSYFKELKRKKFEIKENIKRMEEINNIIKKNIFNDINIDRTFLILEDFLLKKKEHNNYLESFLKKKKEKIERVINEIKKINNNIFFLCQNITVLDNKLITNLYSIKNYINEEINNYLIKNEKINENSIFVTCLSIITKIIEKQKLKNEIVHINFNVNNSIQTTKNNNSQKKNREAKLELELNTQEFLEFENFFS